MYKRNGLAIGVVLLVMAAAGAWAQSVTGGGYLSTDLRVSAGDTFTFPDPSFTMDEVKLDLVLDAAPNENVRFHAEGWVSASGWLPSFSTTDLTLQSALTDAAERNPLSFQLREAYADLTGVFFKALDMRVGRQRIAWGSAEGVSAIDVLDPDDLSDPWNFGQHMASDAVRVKLTVADTSLQVVYVPLFRPALLPADLQGMSLMPDLGSSVPAGVTLAAAPTFTIGLPEDDLWENASVGARLATVLLGWDIALTYVYGRDCYPVATDIALALSSYMPPVIGTVDVSLEYPKRHIVGLDATGELFGLGLWAEASLYVPQDSTLIDVTDLTADDFTDLLAGASISETAVYFFRAVAGLDYTFPFGLYASLQYAYGLPYENTAGTQHHYVLCGIEWKLFHDLVKIGPIGLAMEVDDPEDIASSWGFCFSPQVTLHPLDGAELSLGALYIEGKEGTRFSDVSGANAVYAKARFSF
jgi:hypothetical protein